MNLDMKIDITVKKRDILLLLIRTRVMTSSMKWLLFIVTILVMLSTSGEALHAVINDPAYGGLNAISIKSILSLFLCNMAIILLVILFLLGVNFFGIMPYFFALKKMPGVIGKHTITIEDLGLKEETDFGMMFTKWKGIKSVEKNKHSILISIGDMLYHVIPRRDFSDEKAYRDFYYSIRQYLDAANQS